MLLVRKDRTCDYGNDNGDEIAIRGGKSGSQTESHTLARHLAALMHLTGINSGLMQISKDIEANIETLVSAVAANAQLGAKLVKLDMFDNFDTFWDQIPNHTSAFSACRHAKTFEREQGLACRRFAKYLIAASGADQSADAQLGASIAV